MGIGANAYTFAGATTYSNSGGGGNGGSGEGDNTFVPWERAVTDAKWPTLVIEAGVSQSLASLRNKMAWWFRASEHEVKIVLIMKVDQDARTIRLWKYTKDFPQTRNGATRTRAMPNLEPHLCQEIQIVPQPDNGGLAQYDVIGGPLHLEFALLLLRPADPARGEHDIEISAGELAGVAEFVFAG
ncbi:hypothetical protein SCUCBS95973_000660 [Sporothrix curviconia]|uniref:Uncharacterized protein n=1 Tax=Sporothrix curviconia TaxID=1260050 RepID=A0ABP0AS33_9PEZI